MTYSHLQIDDVSISMSQSSFWLSVLKLPLALNISLPLVLLMTAAITNKTPRQSLAISLPSLMPLLKLVVGGSLSDCLESNLPWIVANPLMSSAACEVSPIAWKKTSHKCLKMPSCMAWSISDGQAIRLLVREVQDNVWTATHQAYQKQCGQVRLPGFFRLGLRSATR